MDLYRGYTSNYGMSDEMEAIQMYENADSLMITNADRSIKEALVYSANGKKQLSYMGIKWLELKMSQGGQPLEIVSHSVELVKHDPEDRNLWIWYATIVLRNKKSLLETLGASEQPFLGHNGQYDNFGRNKALSKAERNAIRKQIPEVEINQMINEAKGDQVQELKPTASSTVDDRPSEKQLNYIRALGHTGEMPSTKQEAMDLISKLKEAKQ